MGLITEHDGAADGYEAVQLPPDPVIAARLNAAMFRRRSARPSRRAVLYLHYLNDSFVPGDLASWYTERGFHFYVADLRPQGQLDGSAGGRLQGKRLKACFAGLDSACRYLRKTDGIDALIVCAHGAGALAAALWCNARREARPADALVLSSPAFGRRLRRGLDIACPVLVISAAGEPGADQGAAGGAFRGRRSRSRRGTIRLGPHVTWLRLDDPLPGESSAAEYRRHFFDEMGRWLGAYMYGQVRDQLL
jgi:hypothetical protein